MKPLDGIRVLDLTHVLAGPYATHQLGCLGAEMIKVERPEHGDSNRGLAVLADKDFIRPSFVGLNLGKKLITLDFKSAADRATLLRLAATADVFVENFRRGVADRLGIGAVDIRKVRPDVVYCSISGWGQTGPMAGRHAYDHVVQAATGMMALQGGDGTGEPVKVGFPVIDMAAGMSAAQAILAALLRRARGDMAPITLDVSLADSALLLMSGLATTVQATGKSPARAGNRGFVGSPGSDTFPTRDGWISVGANTMGQFRRLCAIIGREDLATPPWVPAGIDDNGFLTNLATPDLRAAMVAAFAGHGADDLESRFAASGVPAARVRDLQDYLSGEYAGMPGIGIEDSPIGFGPGWRWLGEPGLTGPLGAAPRPGQHNDEILGAIADR